MTADGAPPLVVPGPLPSWRSPGGVASIVGSFLRRDWTIARSYKLPFVLELASVLMGLAMFLFVGRLIDDRPHPISPDLREGYFAFVVIGLSVVRIAQSTFTSFSAKLRQEQTTGTLEALLSTPPSSWVVILASAAYELIYATASATVTIAAGLLLGMNLRPSGAMVVVLVLGLPGVIGLFTALGVAVAAFTMIFKQTTALLGLVTTGLAVLGGVYFPVSVLPGALETLTRASPMFWAVDVLRGGLLFGHVEWVELGLLWGFTAVSLPLALMLFRASVDRCRRTGGLGHY